MDCDKPWAKSKFARITSFRIPSDPATAQAFFVGSLRREHDFAVARPSDPVGSRQDPAREMREALSEKRISTESPLADPVGSRIGSRLFFKKPGAGTWFRSSAPSPIYNTK